MRDFFDFPNPVNEVAARTVAAGVLIMSLVALILRQHWLVVPLAFGFLARVSTGPRLSPLGRVATQVVAPRLAPRAKLVAGPPKRFAQAIGAVISTTALVLWLSGAAPGAVDVLLGLLVVASGLEAILAFCVGCQIFGVLMRVGLVPESVCAECADVWSRRGSAPSAS